MAEPFLGEIRIMSFGFAPQGWALCNGQFLPINQNPALFSLLGTTYGGNGMTTFALPDLRGRVPMHVGSGHILGERAGGEGHGLAGAELPIHNHPLMASTNETGAVDAPANAFLTASVNTAYAGPVNLVAMHTASFTSIGGSQAHENRQPFLVLNFVIALQGIFPSWN